MPTISVAAPAKVNLHLHVLGRRYDGHHEIESLVGFTLLHDRVTAHEADGLSLVVDGPFAGPLVEAGDDNLVLRAARGLADALDRPGLGAALSLTKRLPVAAGLGGGSADAAAALIALCRLWRVPADAVDLVSLAARLGADVPACLAARAVLAAGVGERLTWTALPALTPIVLANPGVPVPTAAVFRRFTGRLRPLEGCPTATLSDRDTLEAWLRSHGNDLTDAAISIAPEIETVLTSLSALPGAHGTRLSGSGATCFALFANASRAAQGAQTLAEAQPGWWVRQTWLAADARALLA